MNSTQKLVDKYAETIEEEKQRLSEIEEYYTTQTYRVFQRLVDMTFEEALLYPTSNVNMLMTFKSNTLDRVCGSRLIEMRKPENWGFYNEKIVVLEDLLQKLLKEHKYSILFISANYDFAWKEIEVQANFKSACKLKDAIEKEQKQNDKPKVMVKKDQ